MSVSLTLYFVLTNTSRPYANKQASRIAKLSKAGQTLWVTLQVSNGRNQSDVIRPICWNSKQSMSSSFGFWKFWKEPVALSPKIDFDNVLSISPGQPSLTLERDKRLIYKQFATPVLISLADPAVKQLMCYQ